MQIIPVINVSTFEEAKEKIKLVSPYCDWIQIDVADGNFTEHKTWNNPEDLLELENLPKIEAHLMVVDPESYLERWLKISQVKRVLIHLESLNDFGKAQRITEQYGKELGLVINPDTPVDFLDKYLGKVNFVQLLAVVPGLAGQVFSQNIIDKIKVLKQKNKDVIIEIDGGVNMENARILKRAGADVLTSSTYIFNSSDIKEAIDSLNF